MWGELQGHLAQQMGSRKARVVPCPALIPSFRKLGAAKRSAHERPRPRAGPGLACPTLPPRLSCWPVPARQTPFWVYGWWQQGDGCSLTPSPAQGVNIPSFGEFCFVRDGDKKNLKPEFKVSAAFSRTHHISRRLSGPEASPVEALNFRQIVRPGPASPLAPALLTPWLGAEEGALCCLACADTGVTMRVGMAGRAGKGASSGPGSGGNQAAPHAAGVRH